MQTETRLFTMVVGWMIALYGVRRRSVLGSAMTILGLGLADAAITVGDKAQ